MEHSLLFLGEKNDSDFKAWNRDFVNTRKKKWSSKKNNNKSYTICKISAQNKIQHNIVMWCDHRKHTAQNIAYKIEQIVFEK
ncbi:MAG: hypothetical protein D6B25_01270 [Desulfobulbaceae bacterium]|nr:MAG: hypothetical protein D6B25_01270 [Desulfobulbaceae bacterium]